MTAGAIIMMIIAMLIIWGGLAAAITNLMVRGDVDPDDVRTAELHRDL
ncbi:methionine/alanine import family NSS transporter small subunit [Janibacter alittae]|uniref:Methionine/alanine import family NSS transporter small subunit n=1 Tax=Janibacter alittae TaxID=3115209 RepID=A0ABZ2MJK4_9MICO